MDPSLFFDDDGRAYYTRHGEQRDGGIFQAEIAIRTGKLLEEPRQIWRGTGGIWPEGPHLYKVDGTYYLMISEGGTSYDHMITVARSASPFGPFEACENNPILTHRGLPDHPIQATGHADLVQTKDGDWWMVLLGIRPSTERHHHIGRETFLAPVTWRDGWPVVNAEKPLELTMSAEGLPRAHPFEAGPARDDFDEQALNVAWRYVRNPTLKNYSLAERPGFLRLLGTKTSMNDVGSPTLVVRPQTALRTRVATEVHVEPKEREQAGLVVRGNEDNHYQLLVEGIGALGERSVVLKTRIGGKSEEVARYALKPGPVTLAVQGETSHYSFSFSVGDDAPVTLGSAPTSSFAFEKTSSFTGAFVGLYAHSDEPGPAPADFAWFEMRNFADDAALAHSKTPSP
jgi:alpha-N-arabinofuranosidase